MDPYESGASIEDIITFFEEERSFEDDEEFNEYDFD